MIAHFGPVAHKIFILLSKVTTPPLPTPADLQTGQKADKGFQQQPMCQNPLFSAVFPIFCSFPLYQLSGLHFRKVSDIPETVLPCEVFKVFFLVFDAAALSLHFVIS